VTLVDLKIVPRAGEEDVASPPIRPKRSGGASTLSNRV